MAGPDHSTGGGDVEQMDRGTRSHTAQGRTRSGYSSLFYNILWRQCIQYFPVRPQKLFFRRSTWKWLIWRCTSVGKWRNPRGSSKQEVTCQQEHEGMLKIQAVDYILFAVLVEMIPFANWHQLSTLIIFDWFGEKCWSHQPDLTTVVARSNNTVFFLVLPGMVIPELFRWVEPASTSKQ